MFLLQVPMKGSSVLSSDYIWHNSIYFEQIFLNMSLDQRTGKHLTTCYDEDSNDNDIEVNLFCTMQMDKVIAIIHEERHTEGTSCDKQQPGQSKHSWFHKERRSCSVNTKTPAKTSPSCQIKYAESIQGPDWQYYISLSVLHCRYTIKLEEKTGAACGHHHAVTLITTPPHQRVQKVSGQTIHSSTCNVANYMQYLRGVYRFAPRQLGVIFEAFVNRAKQWNWIWRLGPNGGHRVRKHVAAHKHGAQLRGR